ncbi:hypothetical protein ACMDCR_28195 [Labrys okinawensis]|uniref:hypothetical protein n=1 Tax=Labrys okinawensis TaxID=346911 RepID=UPI0039BCD5FF
MYIFLARQAASQRIIISIGVLFNWSFDLRRVRYSRRGLGSDIALSFSTEAAGQKIVH